MPDRELITRIRLCTSLCYAHGLLLAPRPNLWLACVPSPSQQHLPKDPPTLALKDVIATMGIRDVSGEMRAPDGWPGWRKLESK